MDTFAGEHDNFGADAIEQISKVAGLCGHGKEGNWSVKIADYFFVDCGCCWFWRGVIFGALVAIFAMALLSSGLYIGMKGL